MGSATEEKTPSEAACLLFGSTQLLLTKTYFRKNLRKQEVSETEDLSSEEKKFFEQMGLPTKFATSKASILKLQGRHTCKKKHKQSVTDQENISMVSNRSGDVTSHSPKNGHSFVCSHPRDSSTLSSPSSQVPTITTTKDEKQPTKNSNANNSQRSDHSNDSTTGQANRSQGHSAVDRGGSSSDDDDNGDENRKSTKKKLNCDAEQKKKKSKKKRKTQENESSTNASSHNSALDEKLETAIDQLKEVPLSLSPSSTTAAKTFSLPRLHSPLATSIHMPQFLKIDNDDNDDSTKRDPTKAEFMDDDDIAYEAFKEVLCELKTKITNQNKFSIFKGQHTIFETSSESSDEETKEELSQKRNPRTDVEVGYVESDNDKVDSYEETGPVDSTLGLFEKTLNQSKETNYENSETFLLRSQKKRSNVSDSDTETDNDENNGSNDDNIEITALQNTGPKEYFMSDEERGEALACINHNEQLPVNEEKDTNKPATEQYQLEENIAEKRPQTEDSIPFGEENRKYWVQRYYLFSKFDAGIKMDKEGWYSVTPEPIASHIAHRIYSKLGPNTILLDALCGVGGNVIQFAQLSPLVFAIDIDPVKVEMAKHNAAVYNVEQKIEFVIGDCLQLAPHFRVDVVFLSPPWGGPQYLKERFFDLKRIIPNGDTLYKMSAGITKDIVYYLPRNVNVKQLCTLAGPNQSFEIEQNIVNDKLKTITVYFGNLINQRLFQSNQVLISTEKLDNIPETLESFLLSASQLESGSTATTNEKSCQNNNNCQNKPSKRRKRKRKIKQM